MIRLGRPNKIRKGMLLVEKSSKDLFEVLETTKTEFVVQSVFNRRRKTFHDAKGLYIISSPKVKDQMIDELVYDEENDFIVIMD